MPVSSASRFSSGAAKYMKPCCERARPVQFGLSSRPLEAAGSSAGGSKRCWPESRPAVNAVPPNQAARLDLPR